jgi:flagellar hook-length control protein FliK
MAVSGKEAVTEVVNTSRNEAFAKINETANRDAFKGMAKEVVEQIKVNITKSAVKGVDTIDIQLKPEDLGKVQIKMHIAKDGKVQAEIIASRAETADLLQKDASSLSKAFNEAGYDTDAKSFTFSFQDENQARGKEKDDAGLLKFIGDALEQEAEAFAGNDNLEYDPVLGLNIRV